MAPKKSTGPGTEDKKREARHQPVLLDEVFALLQVGPNQDYVDGTLGLGGHAKAILEKSSPEGRLLGIDRDQKALAIAKDRLGEFGPRVLFRNSTFDQVPEILKELGWKEVDGMILDLGMSSFQLEDPSRGFSFLRDSALDMRMDLEEEVTAREGDLSLLLLEREETYGQHASGKNAALFRQAVSKVEIATLIQETARVLRDPPSDWKQPDVFRETGSLLVGSEQEVRPLTKVLHSLAVPFEVFDSKGSLPPLPSPLSDWLRQSSWKLLLHCPSDGVVDIHALLGNYLRAAQRAGLTLRYRSEVQEIIPAGRYWRICCGEEEFRARMVVNGAGAWAPGLIPHGYRGSLPMQAFRRHLFYSGPVKGPTHSWPYFWDLRHEYYFRPEGQGLLLCPGDEEPHPPAEPSVDPQMGAQLYQLLGEHFPALKGISLERAWSCLRTKRYDGRFHLGADEEWPGLVWAAALGGNGVSASYGVGRAVARQIIDALVVEKPLAKGS